MGGGGAYKRQFMVYNSRHESFTLLVNKKQHKIILESVYWYGNCILCKEDETAEGHRSLENNFGKQMAYIPLMLLLADCIQTLPS